MRRIKLIATARQRSCGKVMFSVMSVCHSVKGGVPCELDTHDAFGLTVQEPLLYRAQAPICIGPLLVVTSGGQRLDTGSNLFT